MRSFRTCVSVGLEELGRHTGLSAALLSKLERGKFFPTLPTLLRIAMVFGVGLDYFFSDERKRRVVGVVRREERVRFPERPVHPPTRDWLAVLHGPGCRGGAGVVPQLLALPSLTRGVDHSILALHHTRAAPYRAAARPFPEFARRMVAGSVRPLAESI
jgi:transcriptional regulator with XRE-family HTH domain